MMMDSMLPVSVEQARITLRLADKFPTEDKSKELGIRDWYGLKRFLKIYLREREQVLIPVWNKYHK